MGSTCHNDQRRHRKRSSEKAEEMQLKALISSWFDKSGGGSRKRRHSSTSSSASSVASAVGKRRRRRHDGHDERRDRRGNRHERRSRHGRSDKSKTRRGQRSRSCHRGERNKKNYIAHDESAAKKSRSFHSVIAASTPGEIIIDITSDNDKDEAANPQSNASKNTARDEEFVFARKSSGEMTIKSEPTIGDSVALEFVTRSEEYEAGAKETTISVENIKIEALPSDPSDSSARHKEIVAEESRAALEAATTDEERDSPEAEAKITAEISRNNREETARLVCSTLANAWKETIVRGLSKEANAELLKKYRPLGDLRGFEAPILNFALKTRLSGADIVKDEMKMIRQNQLGGLIEAAEICVKTILGSDKRSSEFARVADTINDTATVTAHMHYSLSIARRSRVIDVLGVGRMRLASHVGDHLFSPLEVEAIERMMETIELERMNEEVENRLAAAKAAELLEEEEKIRRAEEEALTKAKAEAEKKAKAEAEKKARAEAEKKAKAEAEKKAKEEAEKKAKEEAEKKAKEEAERKAAEEEATRQTAAENEAAPQEEQEEVETACSQRIGGSRFARCTLFKANLEGAGGVKHERVKAERVKAERNSTAFVPNSDYPGMAEVTRMARMRQGFAAIAIPIAINGHAPSTLTSYDRYIKMWWDFSQRESVDTFEPKLSDIMQFLAEYWQNGASINTLNTARSALSYILSKELGKNEYLAMLYRGFANGPNQPRTQTATKKSASSKKNTWKSQD